MNEEIKSYRYDYDGFSFVLKIPDYWEKIYKGQPRKQLYYDYRVMLDIVKRVDKSKIIMDVGANHGIFSVPSCMLGYKVIGFEPVKLNFNNLESARLENKLSGFNMYNLALSNENGEQEIYVPECTDNASFSQTAAVANMIHKEYQTEVVKKVKFDDWIKDNPEYSDIGLIKIDAQGSEFNIVEGMKEFLTNASDIYLIAEFEGHLQAMGHSFDELENLILSCGFNSLGKLVGNDRFYKKP